MSDLPYKIIPPSLGRRRPEPQRLPSKQRGFILNPFSYGVGGGFAVDGAFFDGVNDRMTRGGTLTGIADSKQFTFSIWLNPTTIANNDTVFRASASVGAGNGLQFQIIFQGSNALRVLAYNAASTKILDMTTSALATGSWQHVIMSVDLSSTLKRWIYVDGVSDISITTYTNDTIDLTQGDWGVGAATSGVELYDGALAEVYWAPGAYIDLSVAGNRELWRTTGGKPENLGTDGSTPTGTSPIAYFHLNDGEAVANFATNRGTGGDFAITGTLTAPATSPTD